MSRFKEVEKYSQQAADFMRKFNPAEYADGRYDLDDKGLFVNIQSYTTNPRENQKYEAHRRYIDVQYIITGKEGFCLKDMSEMKESDIIVPYSEESDIMFFSNTVDGEYHVLTGGQFLVMPPDCAHMPGMAVEQPSPVRKMVVKIPVK